MRGGRDRGTGLHRSCRRRNGGNRGWLGAIHARGSAPSGQRGRRLRRGQGAGVAPHRACHVLHRQFREFSSGLRARDHGRVTPDEETTTLNPGIGGRAVPDVSSPQARQVGRQVLPVVHEPVPLEPDRLGFDAR